MDQFASQAAIAAFLQVIMIDLVLAGDNAVIIGLAAAGLSARLRQRAILVGIVAATLMRIGFALIAVRLAGGILLLWVAWKMWRELQAQPHDDEHAVPGAPRKTFAQAVWQIVLADLSMSLDNVLAVAGAARDHLEALVFGLGLSIVLMGFAANLIARLLNRQRWIAYVGLVIVLYVACDMIWRGGHEVWPHLFG
jgi:YjbE family integral membrane protein